MSDVDLYNAGPSTALAVPGPDPFDAYAAKFGGSGLFLSFKNNEFQYGQSKEVLPFGTRLVANMAGLKQGWKCWVNNTCVEDRMDLVSSGVRHAIRAELDRKDEDIWERTKEGKPIDPWVMTHEIELVDVESGEAYAFATGAKTYIRAIAEVVKQWRLHSRMLPGEVPVIELSSNSYIHSDPKVGKTYVPVLKVVGWTDADNPSVSDADVRGDDATPLPRMTAEEFDRRDRFGDQTEGQRAANPTRGAGAQTAGNGASSEYASADASMKSPSNGPRRAPREF